jgi:hypothetical protein
VNVKVITLKQIAGQLMLKIHVVTQVGVIGEDVVRKDVGIIILKMIVQLILVQKDKIVNGMQIIIIVMKKDVGIILEQINLLVRQLQGLIVIG